MPDREEYLAFLGLSSDATLFEIESAYSGRLASADDRLGAGDESARVELAILEQVYERLTGRSPAPRQERTAQTASTTGDQGRSEQAPLGEHHLRYPAWWESYFSLLLALASLAALIVMAAYLPHVYRDGGVLIPVGLVALSGLLSIAASIAAEGELRRRRSGRVLARSALAGERVPLRWRVVWISSLLSRAVRWLIVPALIALAFFNFASLSGRWSLRN